MVKYRMKEQMAKTGRCDTGGQGTIRPASGLRDSTK